MPPDWSSDWRKAGRTIRPSSSGSMKTSISGSRLRSSSRAGSSRSSRPNSRAVSAAWKLNDTYFPFLRFGHSDGGGGVAAEDAVSAGVEISRARGEVWTIGLGWAKPSEDTFGPDLDNETVIEMSYKFQIAKNFSLLPDVQVVFNPANNPGESSIWVIGIRAILTL